MKLAMQKLLLLAALLFLPASPALAGVSCTLPFTLTNGTPADATQVMANYNALVACLGNAATAGINTDITALTGLTTPLAPVQGGSTTFLGGTSSGTNAIVVSATTPSNFTLLPNYKVRFIAGGANTTATTLAVGAAAATAFNRLTPYGLQPMVGGEIVAGQTVEAIFDGVNYQMVSQPALGHTVGEVFDYVNLCPVGSLETVGDANVPQAAYPTLFALVGSSWGPASGGNFTIPDFRGRAAYSRDLTGVRITAASGNFNGAVVGAAGGQQNVTIAQQHLPNITLTTSISAGQGSHLHTVPWGVTGSGFGGGGSAGALGGFTTNTSTVTLPAMSGTTPLGGFSAALPTLSHAGIVVKCIKG